MDAISAWVRGIVLLVLAVTFLEMLVPRSGLKKFVDMVMGLAVIGAMVAPLINIGIGYLGDELVVPNRSALSESTSSLSASAMQSRDAREIASSLTESVVEAKVGEALAMSFAASQCTWAVEASVDASGQLRSLTINVCDLPGSDRDQPVCPSDSAIAAVASGVLGVDPQMVGVKQGVRR